MSRRERLKRRRRHRGHPLRRAILVMLTVLVGGGALVGLGLVGWVYSVAESAGSLSDHKPLNPGSTSAVYAADGQRLGFIQSDILRTPVSRGHIPRAVDRATVAIEDRRFYRHKGVDAEGVVRAAVNNFTGGSTQGGSTLTMQLVRNLYIPKEKNERTITRKIKEAVLAQQLEKKHDKAWILTSYLNSVPYGTVGGQTAVGVGAAARMFFDKPVSALSLSQAALLAGLPQAPTSYNPFLSPSSALGRRNEVLRAMAKAGMISYARAARAAHAPLGVTHNRYYTARREQFFFDFVKDELYKRYGLNTVRRGGLSIHTTIDLKKQVQARQAIAGQLNQVGDPASALVTIDPANGYIRAMASSADYGKTKFNYAAQGHRQPGSTFKVMVLMTALRQGIDPSSTTYTSKPLDFNDPKYGPIKVETYAKTYGGSMNLVQATLKSDNTVYQQLDLDVGPDAVRRTAYDMGITTKLDAYPAEGLGGLTLGVSPLEMANASATIASGGWRNRPIAITKVTFPDGRSDDLGKPRRVKAFSDGITAEATKILKQNVQQGTGTAANFGCPAAGKTGTTSDYKDAWFVGFTPRLSTAVWVGYPNPPIPMRSVHGIEVAGGTFPAMIWHDYMNVSHGSSCDDFKPPTQPFQSSSFFGKYASTGGKRSRFGNGYGGSYSSPSYTGGGGGAPAAPKYNPKLYATPPQASPIPGGKGQGKTPGAGKAPGGGTQGGTAPKGGGTKGGGGSGGGKPGK